MLWIVVEVHFVLPVGVVSTQHRLLKRSLSSVGSLVHLRQQPGAHVCVVLLLGPRGRPGAVCLSPPGSTQSRLLKSESEISDSSPFTLLKIVLAVLVPLPFLIRFRMHLSVSTKVSPGLLLKFHSACRSVLGEATPLPCRLPAPEWGRLRPDADRCLPAAFMIQRTRPRHDFTFPSRYFQVIAEGAIPAQSASVSPCCAGRGARGCRGGVVRARVPASLHVSGEASPLSFM